MLTKEQHDRIKQNRERALAIRKRKEEEKRLMEEAPNQTKEEMTNKTSMSTSNGTQSNSGKSSDEISHELEDFEIDASPFVSKQEAMKKYCIPQGTLDVCDYVEKDNPRNAKFSKMKLYHRKEIRERSRKRFEGLQGLIEERRKRELKRFQKDFDDVNDIFGSDKKKKRKTT